LNSGRPIIIASAVVALAVIAGSLILSQSLNRVTQQLDETTSKLESIQGAVSEAKDALAKLPTGTQQAARRGPDPNRRYKIDTRGAPARGPQTAAVTIVEFSDFQ
jgi:protein-disulfide isomerase